MCYISPVCKWPHMQGGANTSHYGYLCQIRCVHRRTLTIILKSLNFCMPLSHRAIEESFGTLKHPLLPIQFLKPLTRGELGIKYLQENKEGQVKGAFELGQSTERGRLMHPFYTQPPPPPALNPQAILRSPRSRDVPPKPKVTHAFFSYSS